jgi:hypothetical protein
VVFKQSSSRIGEIKMKNYVTEYKGNKVPEGATHYASHENEVFCVLFAKWIGNHPVFFDVRNDSWVEDKLIGRHFFKELPEAKWEPIVGEECNHIYSAGSDATKVFIVGIDKKGNYVFQGDGSDCYYSDPIHFFVPLKSAKDLEREAFKTSVSEAVHKSTSTYNDRLEKISSVLFDAGFTAPKESK